MNKSKTIVDTFDNLSIMLNEFKKAYELLEEIWFEVGPYDNTYSDSIRYKLQNYFGFNDNE